MKYIGSSNNLRKRSKDHLRDLSNNKHFNPHLQNSWNKYGEDNFKFYVLELADPESLTETEQSWINKFDSDCLYNTAPVANSMLGFRRSEETKDKDAVEYKLTSPSGEIFEGRNVKKFCLEHDLNPRLICMVMKEKRYHHKGWTLNGLDLTKTQAKQVKLINPNGELVERVGTSKFCKEFGLDETSVCLLLSGKINVYKDWTLPGSGVKLTIKLISPTGEIVERKSQLEFVKEFELSAGRLSQVINGQRETHKGWKLYENKTKYESVYRTRMENSLSTCS